MDSQKSMIKGFEIAFGDGKNGNVSVKTAVTLANEVLNVNDIKLFDNFCLKCQYATTSCNYGVKNNDVLEQTWFNVGASVLVASCSGFKGK